MKVNRAKFLLTLEQVSPGIATKEALQQSSCFIFRKDRVITFNDEISCQAPCEIGGADGAVAAAPLLALLGKLAEEEVNVSISDEGQFMVTGKRRRAGITREAEILLPIKSLETPDSWTPLDDDFLEAVSVVKHCAGKDPNAFTLMCVHITPDFVEACDNHQMARYPVKTGVSDCLVKAEYLKHVTSLGMIEVAETATWLHYRNKDQMVFSVRRQTDVDEFQDITEYLDPKGKKITLPGGLNGAVEKAQLFSEGDESDIIQISIANNKIRVRGEGAGGFYEELKKVTWAHKPLTFSISPKLMMEISTRTNDCQISKTQLRIDGGKFIYVTSLGVIGKDE